MLLDLVNNRRANIGPGDPYDVGANLIRCPKPLVERSQILRSHVLDLLESLLGRGVIHDSRARSIRGKEDIEHFAPKATAADHHDRSIIVIRKQRNPPSP